MFHSVPLQHVEAYTVQWVLAQELGQQGSHTFTFSERYHLPCFHPCLSEASLDVKKYREFHPISNLQQDTW